MRRLRLPAALVAFAALLTSPGITAHAQGGPGLPGYLPPGEYTCHSSFATFHTVVNGSLNVDATVSQATCSNQPKPGFSFPPGGSQTLLTLDAFDYQNGISLSGCYLLSPTDFVATADLSSMTLITTTSSSPSSSCGGPGINSIPDGTKVNLQWLGTGPVASSQNVSHFSCTAYTQENQNGSSNNLASVSGTIGFLTDPLSNIPGYIASGHGDIHVSGIPDQTCPPGGNGFGGPGPVALAPGNYDFQNNQAFATFATPDFSQFFELIATTETDTANPQGPGTPASAARTSASGTRTNGGPVSTTSTQLEIRIENFNTGQFLSGCYVIAPGAFRPNGITSATLHVYLTGQENQCPNSFDAQNIPMPLTVDATLSGTGPSAPARGTGQFSCADYSTSSTSLRNAVTAATKFTLPELFPGQEFDSTADFPGALNFSDTQVHATGIDPQSCIVRGF